ncbi:MAG: helix-hairpin-helix domain-containing protein [Caldimonas sp.]
MEITTLKGRSRSKRRRAVASMLLFFGLAGGVDAAPAASTGVAVQATGPQGHSWTAERKKAVPVKLVDINSASRAELKTLPGIGDTEADRIVAHRPYLSKTELASKNVLPLGPFVSLRRRVVALQPTTAASHR